MKQSFTILLSLLLLAVSARATDLYFANVATGNGSGSDASNCKAVYSFNASGLGAGDTAHMVGIITNQLEIERSGSAGNYLTIKGEVGSVFQSPCWGMTLSNANDPGCAILVYYGDSYLRFTNLFIENTNNGMGLGLSNSTRAVFINQSHDIEWTGCVISNLYNRVASKECGNAGVGVLIGTVGNNYKIVNSKFDMIGNAVQVNMYPASSASGCISNFLIAGNTFTRNSFGVFYNAGSSGFEYGYEVASNTMDGFDAWYPSNGPCAGSYHQDGIIYNVAGSFSNTNVLFKIDGNRIGPTFIAASALIKITPDYPDCLQNCLIFNNILQAGTNDIPANGMISLSANNVFIFNNTFYHAGPAGYSALGSNATNHYFWNNLIVGLSQMFQIVTNSGFVSDWNSHATVDESQGTFADISPSAFANGHQVTYAFWTKSFGMDHNSRTNLPVVFNPDFSLPSGSPVIGKGTNLTVFLSGLGISNPTDINGNPCPATGPWTIGAYQMAGTNTLNPSPFPPTVLHSL